MSFPDAWSISIAVSWRVAVKPCLRHGTFTLTARFATLSLGHFVTLSLCHSVTLGIPFSAGLQHRRCLQAGALQLVLNLASTLQLVISTATACKLVLHVTGHHRWSSS
eukprot:351539-Chlamydomonas_euryale.AAC.2